MKRLPLLLFVLAPVALTGCQTIKAHNPFRHKEPAYKSAQQERPLEVPPGMNQPPTTEALVVPSAENGAATAAVPSAEAPAPAGQPEAAAPPAAAGASMTLADTPESAYHRVGLALARGEVGKVTSHDDAAHTYQIAVDTVVTEKPEGGFLHRMFHHGKSETVAGDVTVSVVPQGTGSLIEASGNPDAAARVIALLQQRLK
ncbi:MAG: hypothetical protein ACREP2_01455 [Rhodanobacteraceae bacterium]